MNMNCLTDFPYPARYYLRHPWKFFAHVWSNGKAAWQRATRGVADQDIWNFDYYLLNILSTGLRKIEDSDVSYPGVEPFETSDKWKVWLEIMASQFESFQEDWAEVRNEYDKPYFHALQEHRRVKRSDPSITYYDTYNDEDIEALRQKWLARIEELNEQQKQETIKAFTELATYFYQLWV